MSFKAHVFVGPYVLCSVHSFHLPQKDKCVGQPSCYPWQQLEWWIFRLGRSLQPPQSDTKSSGYFWAKHPLKFFPNGLSNAVNGPDTLPAERNDFFRWKFRLSECVPTSLQMTWGWLPISTIEACGIRLFRLHEHPNIKIGSKTKVPTCLTPCRPRPTSAPNVVGLIRSIYEPPLSFLSVWVSASAHDLHFIGLTTNTEFSRTLT